MAEEDKIKGFTRFEKARIIGSRALQIASGAPFLIKLSKKDLEDIKYDPIEIAKKEFESGTIPITVQRPFPEKHKDFVEEEEKK